MLRMLFYLVVVFALALGFSWLAERPGELTVLFGGYQYRVSLLVAAIMVTAVVAAVMISWWLLRSLWNSPHAVTRYFRARRRDRGYQALSTGMIAAGAGDSELARRKKKDALKLLSSDQEPLILLLDAQASLLEGDHDSARHKFEAMLKDPELKLLGLRGLYLEAQRLGERQAAQHYAEEAVGLAPQLSWAADATLERMCEAGDWDRALHLIDAQKASRQIERDQLRRRKAVLLTAKAIELLDTDPTGAKNAALEANRLAPDLAPAAVAAANALFRLSDLKRGTKILEAAWKNEPHPEIAAAHVHARTGDSTHDRLTRARKLAALRPHHVESSLVVARTALEAGEYSEARKAIEAALRQEPREGTYLLLADLEEAETGEEGRVRQWLARAVRAPRDPAWVADGYVSENWAPASPVTGRLDAFEWRMPVERLGQIVDAGDDIEPAVMAAIAAPPAKPVAAVEAVSIIEAEPAPKEEEKTVTAAETPASASAPIEEPVPDREKTVVAEQVKAKTLDDEVAAGEGDPQTPDSDARSIKAESEDEVPLPRPPDDPGVDPNSEGEKDTNRFRLF